MLSTAALGFNLRCRCFALMTLRGLLNRDQLVVFQSAMQMFCADDSTATTRARSSSSFNLRCRCFALMTETRLTAPETFYLFQSAMQMFCADDLPKRAVGRAVPQCFNLRCRCFALMTTMRVRMR